MLVSPLRIFTALVVASVAGVSAQTLSSCLTQCLTGAEALADSCTTYTNITCVCSNTVFQTAVETCLKANCSTADQQSAQTLQQAECGSTNSSSGTNSSSSAGSSATSTTPSSSSSSSASTPKSSSGAVHDQVPFLNSVIALATVALGGAFLL